MFCCDLISSWHFLTSHVVRYTGSLEDGTAFEKFGFDGEPFEFIIDEGDCIQLYG